jgi:hypothetical protein
MPLASTAEERARSSSIEFNNRYAILSWEVEGNKGDGSKLTKTYPPTTDQSWLRNRLKEGQRASETNGASTPGQGKESGVVPHS